MSKINLPSNHHISYGITPPTYKASFTSSKTFKEEKTHEIERTETIMSICSSKHLALR